jgi:polysaccharide biosynthesis/export protein
MRLKLLIAILVPCTFCAGQSVLTTPVGAARSVSSTEMESTPGSRQAPVQTLVQLGGSPTVGTTEPASASSTAGDRTAARDAHAIPGQLTTRSDFEKYAEDATGRPLSVYGRQLFDEAPSTFAPVENVPVPVDYVLGPGDQLLIRAWGKIDLDSRETIDRNGQINIPRVGTMTVAGLRYSQVEDYLDSAISALFKDFQLNVTLGQLRSIQIFVLGDARQPGAYTVSSLSTLVDALFNSGGPSAAGSMRRIQLRRAGQAITEFDIYDLIAKGDKSRDVRLLPGDVIFIPPVGPQIAISGDLNRPGIYELKQDATVGAAIAYAGGVTSLADAERAVLERIENHSRRQLEEFALDAQGQARAVKDGDLLRVFPLSSRISNAVTLRGNVAVPGLYAWKDGMHVSDLIPSRSSLITRAYWNEQNHLVKPGADRPFAGATSNVLGDSLTDALGNPRAARSAGEDSTAITSIGQNSAEINWEYAVIERLDERDLSTRLIPFRLSSAIDNPASPDNQLLKPGDVITIFSRADLELPLEKHALFVRVGGEVNAPGIYRVNPGDTLRDVVERAGGMTQHSYLYASIFTRASTRIAQETQLRQSSEQMQRELISKYANATQQAGQTAADQQAQLAMQQAALARLNSIRPTGRVVLNLKPEAAAADIPDIPLEDGDAFYIPPQLSTVQVTGAVYNANAFRYMPGERLINYLNDAGGATRDADQKRIFVIRADGTVVSRQSHNSHSHGSYQNLRLLPGDAIVVPEKLRVSSAMNQFLQTTQFVSQLALTAAAISVIK